MRTVALSLSMLTVVGLACGRGSPRSQSGSASSAIVLTAADSQRMDLFTRALAALTRPANYRLDDRRISGDSALPAIRSGEVVNIGIFTGSPTKLAMVNMDVRSRVQAGGVCVSDSRDFDANGRPATRQDAGHQEAAVLFLGSCTGRKSPDANTLYNVGHTLMTEAQIRARLSKESPIYMVDGNISTAAEALKLLDPQPAGSGSRRHVMTFVTYFGVNAADGGIVEIGTGMPVIEQ